METLERTPLTGSRRKQIQYHISRLGSDNLEEVRRAERYLTRCYGAQAVPQLIEASHSPSPRVRLWAGWALGGIGDSRAYETLIRLITDEDEAVRFDSLIALGKLGDARAVPVLIRFALDDRVPDNTAAPMGLTELMPVARDAVFDLAHSGDPARESLAAYVFLNVEDMDADAFETLAGLIDSTDPETQYSAIWALMRWRDEPALALAQRYLHHPSPVVRAGAVSWLASVDGGEARWLPLVEQAVTDPEADVREAARDALVCEYRGHVPPERLASILSAGLADEDRSAAKSTLLSMFRGLPRRDYTRIVASALNNPDKAVRGRVESVLLDLLRDDHLAAGWIADILACLGKTRKTAYCAVIQSRLDDKSPMVRQAAARADAMLMGDKAPTDASPSSAS